MKGKIATLFFLLFLLADLPAQHQSVFPNLSGQELLDSLIIAYHPVLPLPQAQARDTLFGIIDNHDDSLTCVYTGFTIWLDPSMDPTQAAFMNNSPDAINTEHTYPQSLGATGKAAGDMHHLYPTRADVNAARGNSPFAEIPDNETEEWYYLNQKLNTLPTTNIDAYSERKGDLFEPREDHKGNVARSMFYFYTLYKQEADMANSTYFETQRQTLCAWHYQDPVDQREWDRTWHIAKYQDGKPNPYVLDCTLAERTFCGEFGKVCLVSTLRDLPPKEGPFNLKITPNPLREEAVFSFSLSQSCNVKLEIFNLTGKKVESLAPGLFPAGEHQFFWKKRAAMTPGTFFCRFIFESEYQVNIAATKVVILP